ncbi:MAG: S8 family serine peptidase [Thermoleophilia bacterium]
MRATARIAIGFAVACVAAAAATHAAAADRWIVATTDSPRARTIAAASGAHPSDPAAGIWTAPKPTADALAARLRSRGLLRYTEADVRTVPTQAASHQAPADPAQQAAAGTWWRAKILGTAGELPAGQVAAPVAVIEDGFDPTLPDIPATVTLRRPSPVADSDHGSKVVSVIAGRGPSVYGVNPGSEVRVYGADPSCSDTAAAVRQAVRDGAKVVNMSYGFELAGACRTHREATSFGSNRAVMVAAAGNDRRTAWSQPGNDHHVVTVGALNQAGQPTFFSNQGAHTDLTAPGEGIGVACPLFADSHDGTRDGLCTVDGTSFSAPMVAAVAARVIAARPDLAPNQVANLLRDTATDIGPRSGWDIATGYGMVNLPGALSAPAPPVDYFEPNEDIEWLDGRHFTADKPLLRPYSRIGFNSTLDRQKDPWDVYPVWVGPRQNLAMHVRPRHATLRIAIHYPNARTARLASSRATAWRAARPGRSTRVVVSNNGNRGLKAWVSVHIPAGPIYATRYNLRLVRGDW